MSFNAPTIDLLEPSSVPKAELERILDVQRSAFLKEGFVSAAVRKDRVSRVALLILEHIDAISDAVSLDYGYRPAQLTKAFEATSWLPDVLANFSKLDDWMQDIEVPGGFVQQKPKGVVGVIGAWNFPIILSFEPVMAALLAGNRVMLNFSEFHVRTGRLLSDLIGDTFDEAEFAIITGDLATARSFAELHFDHLMFTGSPTVGSLVAQAAAKNLVPVTLELGGKNPVVVSPSADLDLAAHRIAGTRALNSGQICLCPDYVFVPRDKKDEVVTRLKSEFQALYPDFLENPGVVAIVNDRNYDRVVGLIDDAVAKGATQIVVAPEDELGSLPNRETRRIAPTILLDVPESARISSEEIFGPVLPLYVYDDIQEVVDYVSTRPTPLAAYWYGEDDGDFRSFLDHTNSGGVTRNDGITHALLPDAPFGGAGHSGYGSYHSKDGFDTFTHRRTVSNVVGDRGVSDGLIGRALDDEQFKTMIDGVISGSADAFKANLI